jgi:DNA-directed RNA polymerase subunit RPC12/RpoP
VYLQKLSYECRICGKVVNYEQYKNSPFCPDLGCGTKLQLKPQPKHWLFQFNPSIYNWFGRTKETREAEQWLVSQLWKLIRKDDLIAIWSSGQKAGIYALGQVITNPAKTPLNIGQKKFFSNLNYVEKFCDKYSAYVEYSHVFLEKPLTQEACSQDDILSKMQILVNQQRTNFRLTGEEWERIVELTV